jgi:hypothetical protein
MKKVFYFLIIIFFAGCSKEGGKLVWNMTYSLSSEKSMANNTKAASTDNRYTRFGTYITSITPTRFVAKFLDLRLCSTWGDQRNNLNIIDGNLPWTSTDRIADFSNNNTVNINITGNIANDVNMIYLVSVPMFYYQEFELPEQYNSFIIEDGIDDRIHFLKFLNFGGKNIDYPTANAGIGGQKEGRLVKGSDNPLIAPIFDNNWTGFNGNFPEIPHMTVFGKTDSTFIFHSNGSSADDPLGSGGDIIRSHNFNPITLHAISDGETKAVNGTMTFNTTDLIQIYAGADNMPYTNDDIFVYAPRYWERLSVSLTSY